MVCTAPSNSRTSRRRHQARTIRSGGHTHRTGGDKHRGSGTVGGAMKFAFITPRYGADITAGPDHACRLLAEQVSTRHDVDVLTTCSRGAGAWKNDLTEGADRVRGALVRRFAVS